MSAEMANNERSANNASDVLIVEDDPVQRAEMGSFLGPPVLG